MDKRFILLSCDDVETDTLNEVFLSYLKDHGEFFGPFKPHDDRNFTAALKKLNKQYECFIFLDKRLLGTDCYECVEFARAFSPTLNHLLCYDLVGQQIFCSDDVSFPFSKSGLDGLFSHMSEVCAYDG